MKRKLIFQLTKKALSLILAVITLFAATLTGSFVNAANKSKFMPSRPSYEKVDQDLAKEAAEAGTKVTGKKLYTGNAYMKPDSVSSLAPVDRKGFDHTGIAILVDFPETEPGKSEVPGVDYGRIPKEQFDNLLNGESYNPYGLDLFSHLAEYEQKDEDGNVVKTYTAATDRTMKNYFKEVSYEQFGITVDVTDWITLPHSYNYYLGQDLGYYNDNGDAHIGELVSDAIDLADAKVDFSKYAIPVQKGDFADLYGDATSFTDKNGNKITQIVPNIFIIHRGTGAEYNEDPNVIWSHKWDILSANYFGQYYQTGSYPADSSLAYKVVDGICVNTYDICPK
jgi:M6 family metalloprotease-like protein